MFGYSINHCDNPIGNAYLTAGRGERNGTMTLSKTEVKMIEAKLNTSADAYYAASNAKERELNRGYCQGIAYILGLVGYSVEWDNGKAYVVNDAEGE